MFSSIFSSLFFSLLFLFETSLASCKLKFIHNASELIEFSNDVNRGTTYDAYTVYLVADIDFAGLSSQFKPIGYFNNNYDYNCFTGVFDGQGYVISNIVFSSSSFSMVGLFGHTSGATISNVVVDDSCSFSSTYSGANNVYASGINGYCTSTGKFSTFRNIIDVATISYSGTTNQNIYMGGIVGCAYIINSNYGSRIVNCANYGAFYNYGTCSINIQFGGIVGEAYAPSGSYANRIVNCINYGVLMNAGTAYKKYYVGGITGLSWGASIINCVSAGKVTSTKSAVGGIVSSVHTYATITHSYWTSSTGCSGQYSTSTSDENKIAMSSTYANSLNSYAIDNQWNGWAYNQNNKNISFIIHEGKGLNYSLRLIPLPEAVRRGYSFLFWCVNENSTEECNTKYEHSNEGFTSETTLYAQWVVNKCDVTLNVNGGDELPENKKVITTVYDEKLSELPEPTRRGYSFVGWFNVLNELVTSKSLVNNACNCSLTAYWIPNNYTVTFDVKGGNELANNKTMVTFNNIYGELPLPNRTGFTFSGWFTNESELVTNVTIVNITGDQTLYANWTANVYTVTLDVNGGTELTNKNVTVLSDKAYEFLPVPNKNGYTFAGWFTEDGGLITNDTTTTAIVTRNQTLRAEWTPNNYTVSFNVNGGDGLTEEKSNKTVTFDAVYGSLPEPTRKGYTFVGWFDGSNESITNETTVNITSDYTLYANWTANNYTIMFIVNGGEELSNITVTFDSNYSCLPTPTREGYEFLWWYIEDTKEIIYNTTVVGIACNHTLCATWNRNTIVFDVNGGEELEDDKKEMDVTYNDIYETLPTPSRTGYEFSGWFTEDGEEIKDGSNVNITYDQTIKAEWMAKNYTMSLNVNGGDALNEDEKSINVTYDGMYGYLPTPTRTGYTFSGWYTENNELVTSDMTVKDACSCTLHANWTANTYTIILVVNGGELGEDKRNITVIYDDTYDSLPTPSKEGYEFAGWYTNDNEEITCDRKVTITYNQILYAHWIEIDASSSQTVIPSKYVEVVFGKGDMNDKEVKDILKKFTKLDFDIMKTDRNKSGEATVIIKFDDVEDAKDFLTALNESSDSAKNFIRSASFNSGVDASLSLALCPSSIFGVLLI